MPWHNAPSIKLRGAAPLHPTPLAAGRRSPGAFPPFAWPRQVPHGPQRLSPWLGSNDQCPTAGYSVGGAAPSQHEQPLGDGVCHLSGSPPSHSGSNAHWGRSSCSSTASSPNLAAEMASHGRWSPLHMKHRPSSAGSAEWPPIKGEFKGGERGAAEPWAPKPFVTHPQRTPERVAPRGTPRIYAGG